MTTEPLKTIRHRRESPDSCYPGHNATVIEIDGELVEVDTRILKLVEVMNTIPGLTTTGSCRGGRGPRYIPGYVAFEGPGAVTFMLAMAKKMAELYARMSRPPIVRNYMTHFAIGKKESPRISWQPPIYPLVLRAARQVSEAIRPATEAEIKLDATFKANSNTWI